MTKDDRVAIFLDAENLTQWIKRDGPKKLIEELNADGTVLVRKAYARWTSTNLADFQQPLNLLGFELIHTFHPVNGKNSADIQIAVDAMQYALQESVQTIVLATGDADFSPLFRRLRELGKDVIGVGPTSRLSECVESSCSRFIYTGDEIPQKKKVVPAPTGPEATVLKALQQAIKITKKPVNCSCLKQSILKLDPDFDKKHKRKTFTTYLRTLNSVELTSEKTAWFAYPKTNGVAASNGQH